MPKDKDHEVKKKMVVVEEVVEESPEVKTEEPKVEKIEKEQITPDVQIEEDRPNYLWIIIPTALLVGALVGGLITYFSGLSRLSEADLTPTPIATVEPEVNATPSPESKSEVKRDLIILQVLNGSGTAGLAGKAKTYLEGLGYKNVAVGNASTSDFAETVISVKESKKDLLETVKADLAKNYQVAKEIETLSASSKYDFVITLGKK